MKVCCIYLGMQLLASALSLNLIKHLQAFSIATYVQSNVQGNGIMHKKFAIEAFKLFIKRTKGLCSQNKDRSYEKLV